MSTKKKVFLTRQPATLDEELSMIRMQIEQARKEQPEDSAVDSSHTAPAENDADERTRTHFLRGTETVSDGYLNRLSFREPAPSSCDDPIGREYRRRNR